MATVAEPLENEAVGTTQSRFRNSAKEMGREDHSLKVHYLTGHGPTTTVPIERCASFLRMLVKAGHTWKHDVRAR